MSIYYFCPDATIKSAGVRTVYRHVCVLVKHGYPAWVMHVHDGFRIADAPDVPLKYLQNMRQWVSGDVIVIPELSVPLMIALKEVPIRKLVLALNWDLAFQPGTGDLDYKVLGIERVLTHSPLIGKVMAWATKLPANVFRWGINGELYYPTSEKQAEVVYIQTKQDRIDALQRVLRFHDPRLTTDIKWTALQGLSEPDYAAAIRRAAIFLNLSRAEGLPCSLLEAMRCNTLVAGYSSIGGQDDLIAHGPRQNGIRVETMDYPALAMHLAPILQNILRGDYSQHARIIQNAYDASLAYGWETEEASILELWNALMQAEPR
jgi:hypothetical protein